MMYRLEEGTTAHGGEYRHLTLPEELNTEEFDGGCCDGMNGRNGVQNNCFLLQGPSLRTFILA